MQDIDGDQLIEAMTDPVFVVDAAGVIQRTNAAAERQTGYAKSELAGRAMTSVVFDSDTGSHSDLQGRLAAGGAFASNDSWLEPKSGPRVPVSLTASPLLHAGGSPAMWVVVMRDRTREVELMRSLAESEQRLEGVRDQRLRSERLATLGKLAGGVGHELRNLAQLQVLALEALVHEVPALRSNEQPALTDLERTSQQVAVHAQRLLQLAHPSPENVRPANLGDVIREVTATLASAGKLRGITTEFAFDDQNVCVAVNKTRLEQVVFNLVINALEAMGLGGGTLRIATHGTGAKRAVVEVADTGPGIAVATLPRIFEPFFTTKPRGATGLGLSVAKEIVEGHGGQLQVASNSSTGATFRFDLPRASHDAPSDPEASK